MATPTEPVTPAPTLRVERALLRSGARWLAAVDEVGRGSLAGPVSVGVVVVDAGVKAAPVGVRDSKLLSAAARLALVPRIRRWAPAYAVGHAEPAEIDAWGIIAALRLAAHRALAGLIVWPDVVLLDGNHDWLSGPAQEQLTLETVAAQPVPSAWSGRPRVVTRIKADRTCAAVAAASVLAKVERDAIMVSRSAAHPAYRWADNKGYAAPEHVEALLRHGPCCEHRRSWRLPGIVPPAAGSSARAAHAVPDLDVRRLTRTT